MPELFARVSMAVWTLAPCWAASFGRRATSSGIPAATQRSRWMRFSRVSSVIWTAAWTGMATSTWFRLWSSMS